MSKHTELMSHEASEKTLASNPPKVLILTPVKDGADYLDDYFDNLKKESKEEVE